MKKLPTDSILIINSNGKFTFFLYFVFFVFLIYVFLEFIVNIRRVRKRKKLIFPFFVCGVYIGVFIVLNFFTTYEKYCEQCKSSYIYIISFYLYLNIFCYIFCRVVTFVFRRFYTHELGISTLNMCASQEIPKEILKDSTGLGIENLIPVPFSVVSLICIVMAIIFFALLVIRLYFLW